MILPEKVARLKHSGLAAVRLAMLWEQKIETSGVKSAEDLYLSLGHNHIERKSAYEWEGLTLSREPKDHEKLCVKGVSEAQDSGKAAVSAILLKLRTELISDAVKAIKKLTPATYHKLILAVPDEFRIELGDQLSKIYRKGRRLVASELGKKSANSEFEDAALFGSPSRILINGSVKAGNAFKSEDDEDDDPDLDDLIDLTDIRVANEIQARIAAAAARFTLLGLVGDALWGAVEKEVGDGSTGWLERIATGASNKVLSVGRADEMEARTDDIDRYEQSAILDQNTCGPCSSDDGMTSASIEDLPGAPHPECEGSDYCRDFIVAISN